MTRSVHDVLAASDLLTADQLRAAAHLAEAEGIALPRAVVRAGLDEDELMSELSRALELEVLGTDTALYVPLPVRMCLVIDACRRHQAYPVALTDGTLTVAFVDPTDEANLRAVEKKVRCGLRPILLPPRLHRRHVEPARGDYVDVLDHAFRRFGEDGSVEDDLVTRAVCGTLWRELLLATSHPLVAMDAFYPVLARLSRDNWAAARIFPEPSGNYWDDLHAAILVALDDGILAGLGSSGIEPARIPGGLAGCYRFDGKDVTSILYLDPDGWFVHDENAHGWARILHAGAWMLGESGDLFLFGCMFQAFGGPLVRQWSTDTEEAIYRDRIFDDPPGDPPHPAVLVAGLRRQDRIDPVVGLPHPMGGSWLAHRLVARQPPFPVSDRDAWTPAGWIEVRRAAAETLGAGSGQAWSVVGVMRSVLAGEPGADLWCRRPISRCVMFV